MNGVPPLPRDRTFCHYHPVYQPPRTNTNAYGKPIHPIQSNNKNTLFERRVKRSLNLNGEGKADTIEIIICE
jgi:hypothetical protein